MWQRINNTVYLSAEWSSTTAITGTGAYIRVGGLPFAVSGTGHGTCVIRYASSSPVPPIQWNIDTEGYLFMSDTTSGSTAYNYIDTGSSVKIMGSYRV